MQNFGVTNKEHYGMLWYSQFIEFILVRGKLLSISRVRYNHSESDGQEKKKIEHRVARVEESISFLFNKRLQVSSFSDVTIRMSDLIRPTTTSPGCTDI